LLAKYSAIHPDVVMKEREISQKKADLQALRVEFAKRPVPSDDPVAQDEPDVDDTAVAQLKSQLQANAFEIKDLLAAQEKLKSETEKYSARLNMTPVREQQLSGLLRDYELLKQNYADLLSKKLQSQLATTLEKRQEGQQFRVVDPPNLPNLPSSPKRLRILLGGLAGGLALGILLAFLLEMKNSSPQTEQDCSRICGLSMVIGIPILPTPGERRRLIFRRVMEAACVLVLSAGSAAASAHALQLI